MLRNHCEKTIGEVPFAFKEMNGGEEGRWITHIGVMPDFSTITEDQLEGLLPKPLWENYRLIQSFVRLVESARSFSDEERKAMVEALQDKTALDAFTGDVVGIDDHFFASMALIKEALERSSDEAFLADLFQKLQEKFGSATSQERFHLLLTIDDLTQLFQPVGA